MTVARPNENSMNRNIIPVVVIALVGVATFSCKSPTGEDVLHEMDETSSTTSANLPLVQIMQGLETDLAEVAHGIWTRDPAAVRLAAIRIAEHPKVPPEQLSAIKLELGDELGSFVLYDDRLVKNPRPSLGSLCRSWAL